jgi:hypothetical protein
MRRRKYVGWRVDYFATTWLTEAPLQFAQYLMRMHAMIT